MATVKLQNGKVITKSGKVSCTCCGGEGCCMYPAQALADGLYTINDLPDEIVVQKTGNPITLQRGIGSSEPPQIPGAFYGSSDPNGNEDYVFLYNGFWEYGPGVPVCSQAPCLITDLCAKDKFADTYTFASAGMTPPSVVVTRRSLCRWDFFEEDPEGGGRYWILEYANDRGPDALWYFTIPSTFPGYKTGLQNSPVGTYTGSGLWTGTIS